MSYEFLKLTATHEPELFRLFDSTDNGAGGFKVMRGDDFFALASESGQTSYYGMMKDGELLACIGVTVMKRYIKGEPEDVYYLCDLRMAPGANAMVYGRLIRGLLEMYAGVSAHAFSVVLEENPNKHAVTAGKNLFGCARQIGEIVHTGFPLFYGRAAEHKVEQITMEEAWHFYHPLSQQIDYAPADESCFKERNGFFLGVREYGKLTSICKIIDQEDSRQIVSTNKPTMMQRLLNFYCRLKKYKELPAADEVFAHCYLSFYTTVASADHRERFIAFLRKNYAAHYSYVFTGLMPQVASSYKGLFNIRFNSFVYGYGSLPDHPFSFPELTLI